MSDNAGLQFNLALPGANDTAVVRFTHREFTLSVDFPALLMICRPATVWIRTLGEKIIEMKYVVKRFGLA